MSDEPTKITAEDFERYQKMQRHFAEVGAVATAWAMFELTIDEQGIGLAGFQAEPAYCFTAQIVGSGRKLDAYIAIARLKGADCDADLEAFAKDTTKLAERRNRVVHDPWAVTGKDGPARYEITARRKLRNLVVPASTDEVNSLGKEIVAHSQRFSQLDKKVRDSIAASQNTQP